MVHIQPPSAGASARGGEYSIALQLGLPSLKQHVSLYGGGRLWSNKLIKLTIHKVCTVFGRGAFPFAADNCWNKLTVLTSLTAFKLNLQRIVFDCCAC